MAVPYQLNWDLATIPDAIWYAEVGRRLNEKRTVKTGGRNGGRPMPCGHCGSSDCAACVRRVKRAARKATLR